MILSKEAPLYVIVDEGMLKDSLIKGAECVLRAGVKLLQLRAKEVDEEEFLILAQTLRKMCKKYDACFVVNDNVEIARKICADGLHLGQGDTPLNEARKVFNGFIGISAHTLEEAFNAKDADYISIGPIFPTQTKKGASCVFIETLKKIREALKEEILCAIGGINENNIKEVIEAGADIVCMHSGIFSAKDPEERASFMLKKIKELKRRGDDKDFFM